MTDVSTVIKNCTVELASGNEGLCILALNKLHIKNSKVFCHGINAASTTLHFEDSQGVLAPPDYIFTGNSFEWNVHSPDHLSHGFLIPDIAISSTGNSDTFWFQLIEGGNTECFVHRCNKKFVFLAIDSDNPS